MLDGFGLAPLCIELDLDSYDGPWTHVERFRGQSGWLVVAEAEVISVGTSWITSLVAACDSYLDPVPMFMAPHLLACACSLPVECDEYPPEELDDLLAKAAQGLKLQWLRESNAALGTLTETTLTQIGELEGRARRDVDELDYRIADLRRRRRMPGVSDAAREILHETILAFEEERDSVIEQLAQERTRLRMAVEREERALVNRTHVHVAVEPLYHIRWSAQARPHEEWAVAREQARRLTGYIPGSSFVADRGQRFCDVENHQAPAVRVPADPSPTYATDVAVIAKAERFRVEGKRRAASKAVRKKHELQHELAELKMHLAKVEAAAAKFFPASRKFFKNQRQQEFLHERIEKLEARLAEASASAAVPLDADGSQTALDLNAERTRLAAELTAHEQRGARREDGSRRFIRYGERRRALIAEIAQLDRRIAVTQPLVEVDL